jgi:DNA-binding response OmpR family regulator
MQLMVAKAIKIRVLLVEDDVNAARGIVLIAKSSGAVVDLADTSGEALELVRHYDYDIVVLDLMLPDMGGARWCAACGPVASTSPC